MAKRINPYELTALSVGSESDIRYIVITLHESPRLLILCRPNKYPMKKAIFILLTLFSPICNAQTAQELENLFAFNKLYGYVKYFHPSDEAASIDWDKFAIYGSGEVLKCKDVTCLQKTLVELFEPIAPTIQIVLKGEEKEFSKKTITPPDTTGFDVVTWQHKGVGNGLPRNVYQSGRINRPATSSDSRFCSINTSIKVQDYQGKPFLFSASVRLVQGPGTAHLWARIDRPDRRTGFFDNMDKRPITSKDWSLYEIAGTVDEDAINLAFGCFLKGKGKLVVDDLVLKINEGNEWKTVYSNSFESDSLNTFPASVSGSREPDYKTLVTSDESSGKKQIVAIESTDHSTSFNPLFAKHCRPGEYIKKDLTDGLSVVLPLALYGTTTNTWPVGDRSKLSTLQRNLENVPSAPNQDIAVRTGGIIIAWNVFQHFYPYFDVVKVDWKMAFKTAVEESFTNRSPADYLMTLRRLTAKLKDGHADVYSAEAMVDEGYAPPIAWEWIENELVITKVGNDDLTLKPGDIVTTINDMPAHKFFQTIYPGISAATPGWLHFRANASALFGPENSSLIIKLLDVHKSERQVTLTRTLTRGDFFQLGKSAEEPIRTLMERIHYIDLSKASMEDIRKIFPDLEKAKAIIFDLRGYPKGNHAIISHLLTDADTSQRWMRVPQIIYPDQENITGYAEMGWGMKPQKPHLEAKIFFLLDGSAISYAESFMGFIEHYNLATIVGQPSAGTNGNVNRFQVPGGYFISWTGMKVFKHDGSALHGVGILPDVYVEKTIQGVRDNRDEFLEKAIELATATLHRTK